MKNLKKQTKKGFKVMNVNGYDITIEMGDNIFSDAYAADNQPDTHLVSLKEDLVNYPKNTIISQLRKDALIDTEMLFSDCFPDEPSEDHFVVLSLDGKVTLLPQESEPVLEALTQLENKEILDVGRIRIEAFAL